MKKNPLPSVAMLMMTLLLAAGCNESRDERYSQLAQQALREQSEQNNRLAEQSQQIAEASRRLVDGDAQARNEMIAAHAELQKELHAERANINQQRSEMESERRALAAQRHRDPVVAQAIGAFGLTLGCLLPLLLAAYVIHALTEDSDETAALSELLVMEITADQPLLLPISRPHVAALEQTTPEDSETTTAR